jgi:hypothetical protein
MPDARPLFLALALEAAPMRAVRLMRASGQKSAYVATLVVAPDRDAAGQVKSGELSWTVSWDSPARVLSGGN